MSGNLSGIVETEKEELMPPKKRPPKKNRVAQCRVRSSDARRKSGQERPPIEPVVVRLENWPEHAKKTLAEIERSERLTAEDMAVTINARPPEKETPDSRFPWQKELRERAKQARDGEQITTKDLGIVVR